MSEPGDSPLGLLGQIGAILEGMGRRYALVGGLAVSVRGEVRFTRDVDLAVVVDDDADAEGLVRQLRPRGFVPVATVEQQATGRLATVRLSSPGGLRADLLFASSGIEREIVSAANAVSLPTAGSIPVATAEHLVAMKILSVEPERPQDAIDLAGLFAVSAVDLDVVRRALVRITEAGCNRGQDLGAKLDAFLADRAARRR